MRIVGDPRHESGWSEKSGVCFQDVGRSALFQRKSHWKFGALADTTSAAVSRARESIFSNSLFETERCHLNLTTCVPTSVERLSDIKQHGGRDETPPWRRMHNLVEHCEPLRATLSGPKNRLLTSRSSADQTPSAVASCPVARMCSAHDETFAAWETHKPGKNNGFGSLRNRMGDRWSFYCRKRLGWQVDDYKNFISSLKLVYESIAYVF